MAVSSGNGMFRNGASTGISHTAFDPSLEKVNSYNQGSSAGGYTARAGETLGSIAANLWGDSSLWYKLAQANGLSGEAALSEGQSLRIPAGVMKNTHNASTFKPYDPAETLGDTAPTAAKPPKKNKCGAFGQVLLVVIAVAVSLATVNPFTGGGILGGMASAGGASAFAAGSIAGAAGSIASQAVGVATGIQEKFSWTGVAQAALGGGIGSQNLGISGSGFGASVARGALGNVLSQAASTALGPQKKFSWSGVAAAGIGAGVGAWATRQIGGFFDGLGETAGDIAAKTTAGTAAAIASAATRTAFGDGNFGDNVRRSIPDVIGQALGSALGTRGVRAVASAFGLNGTAEAGASFADSTTVTYRSDGSVQGDGTSVLGTVVVSAKQDDVAFRSLWGYMDYLTSRNLGDMYGQVEAGSASRLSDNLNALAVRAANLEASSFGLGYRLNGLIGEQNILTGLRNQQVEARSNRDQVIAEAQADRAARLSFFLSERVISAQIGQGAARYEASSARSLAAMGFTSTSFEATSALVADARAWLDSSRGARAELTAAIHDGQRGIVDGLSVAAGPVGAIAGAVSLADAAMRGELTALDALNFVPLGRLGAGRLLKSADQVPSSAGSGVCFAAGTLVHTRTGLKPIETISAGDEVLAQPEFKGEQGWRRVLETFVRNDQELLRISIRSGEVSEDILATTEHPFWVTGKGWTGANALQVGDLLELSNGGSAQVASVTPEEAPADVFNFAVDGFHTYYVGALGIWVHNACWVGDIGKLDVGPNGMASVSLGAAKGTDVVGDAATWDRLSTVGRTPGKSSSTGRAVVERMVGEGKIMDDPVVGRMFKGSDGQWYPMSYGDMSHTTNAVSWWNATGRSYGAKAPEVRQWMLNSDNYVIDYYSINRSAGAKLGNSGVRYLPPLK